MSRQELEAKAYEAIKADMSCIGTPDEEIWENIKTATDEVLEKFIEA